MSKTAEPEKADIRFAAKRIQLALYNAKRAQGRGCNTVGKAGRGERCSGVCVSAPIPAEPGAPRC